MKQPQTADELLPLVLELPPAEQQRLARLTLEAAARNGAAVIEAPRPVPGTPGILVFEGTFFDEGTADEQQGNTIERGTLREENGQRILRLQGMSDPNNPFELEAPELDPIRSLFKGTWWFKGDSDDAEDVELTLYGDPAGEFALVGHHVCGGETYYWTFQLYPFEE